MNAGLITAVMAAAAAAVFTVWLCTGDVEAPPSKRRPSTSAAGVSAARPFAEKQERSALSANAPDGLFHRSTRGAVPDSAALPPQETAGHQPAVRTAQTIYNPPPTVPVLPLAFREMPGDLHLEPAQVQAVEDIQDQFIESLGGEPADPAAPEYRRKWLDTQRLADLQLRARIGGQAFAGYQRQRSLKENAAAVKENVPAP